MKQRGYTLIELLMYISIIGGLLLAMTGFLITMTETRLKNQAINEVEQQGSAALEIMAQTIRNASAVTAPIAGASANQVTLVIPSPAANSPTIFGLNGTTLQVKKGTAAAVALTNSRVAVTNLSFVNLTRSGTKNILRISLTLQRVNPTNRAALAHEKTFTTSAMLRY